MSREAIKYIWAVVEVFPSPIGDVIKIAALRDRKEDAEIILKALKDTNHDWSCYAIMRYPIGKEE